MGTYPDTSLKLAREKRDIARGELAADIDPSIKRKAQKKAALEAVDAQKNTFSSGDRTVARDQWRSEAKDHPTTRAPAGKVRLPKYRLGSDPRGLRTGPAAHAPSHRIDRY